jgi:cytochrome oxidase Cu insertion factor (SCO1/SenC/PrrC family)
VSARSQLRLAAAAAIAVSVSATVILLNLALLGYAQPRNDPVGRLNPKALQVEIPKPIPAPLRQPSETDTNDD